MEEGGFTLVRRRGQRRGAGRAQQATKPSQAKRSVTDTSAVVKEALLEEPCPPVAEIEERVRTLMADLHGSTWFDDVSHTLVKEASVFSHGARSVTDIVCYGIGRFGSSEEPAAQLALLVLMHDHAFPDAKMLIFDPILRDGERECAQRLNVEVIGDNEAGARTVQSPTVFYMPHCGRPLYNNTLRANWGKSLTQMIIVGNSFGGYRLRLFDHPERDARDCINLLEDFSSETPLPNHSHWYNAFNNTAVHAFHCDPAQEFPPLPEKHQDEDTEILLG